MSWAADEWKVDLSHRALQKVEQLEAQMNRFKKESEMKQFKLDSMEQVVQKEKRRADDEKSQVAALKREIQSLSESCDDVEQKRQKLATEVHTKETHINAISGQLAHLKKSLDQETSKVAQLQVTIEKYECENMGQGDKYEKLNTEYEKLKQMNQHQVAECSAFKNECNSLKQKVSDLENQVANVQNENCNMKSDLKEKNSVKESEFKNVTAQLKVEKENFKILEKKSSDEIKNLRNLLETKEKEIDRIVMDSKGKEEKFTATLKAITMEVQNLKDSNIRKTNQDSQAKAKLEQEMGELKGNLGCKEQELLKLNKDLKFLRDSLTNAQTNAESLKADIKNKEIGLSKQKELTDNLQKDLDRQVKDLSESNEKHEQRIKSILKELENVKDQNKNLLSRFEKAERENETLRSESKSVKEENESLGKKILGLEKTKDCLTTQIGQIKIETEKLIQMNGSFKQETDELKNMLTGKEREAEHLKVELSHTVEKLQDSDMKRDTIHSECQKYEELAHTLQNELSSEKLKFEDECKSLKSVISVNEQNLKHLQGDYDKLKIEIEDMKACNENLITKGKEHEHNYERAVIDNAELEKTLENKIKEIETLHMKLNKLAEEMKDTVIEKSATEKEIEELKFNQESLQDRLNSVENHLETANKQLLETTENINALKAENQILFSENRQCNEQLEIVKTELDGKNNQHIKDQEVIACVQQDLSLLRDKCGVMKAEETDRTNQFLQEIESLRSELEGKTHIIDSLETQIQNKTSECERIQKLFDTITIENTDMTMRTNSLQGKIEELVSSQDDLMNLKEKYELEISNMKTEIIKHKDELQTAQNLEKEFSIEMNRKLEELNNIAAGKETEIESCKIEISHSYEKIDSLNKLVLEANNAVEEKDLIIQKQSSEINELKTNVSETSEALQKYAHDYDGCIRQITAFKDMESENKAKFNEFKIQADNEIETLKLLIEKKESDLKAVQQEISKKCLELQETTNKLEHTLAAKCEAESNIQQLLTETEAQKSMIFSLQEEKDRLVAETESLLCDLKLSKDMSHEKELDTTAVITQLNENLRELQIILEDRDKEIEGLRKSVSDKTETFDLKLSELLLKEKENKECLTQITLLERCNEELQHQIRNEREFREVTDSHNKELKVEVDTLKDRVGNLSIESSDQLSKLSRELSETQIVVEEKVVEIEKMKSELCQKTDELIEKEAEFEKVCILKSDMEIMVKTLEKENETLHFSMSDMKDGKHQAEAELDKLKTEIKQLQDDLSDQAMEESVNTAKLNQEIKELHSCVESKDSELNELREKFCCKSEVLQAKKTEIENVLAANLELENKIFGLNTTIDETKHLLSEALKREENLLEMTSSLKNEAKEMQDKINSQRLEESVKLANLNQELADAQNNSALKEQELSSLKDSAEAREMEMQTLRKEIAKVLSDKALVESVQASQEKELDELKFRFSDTNSKLENMILSISEKEKEVISLKDDLSDEAMEHSVIMAKLNQKLKELESEVESKEMQIKKVKEENNQISDLYQKEHTVKVSLEEENSSKELELLTAKEKVKELTFEIEEAKKATMSNLDHIAALNGSIVSLKDELQLKDQELSGKVAEVQKTSSELSSALYVKEQELETSKTEICHMNGRISEMETLLETSRKVTQESENLNAKYLKENEELNVTIAGKNDEIQTIKIALERAVDEKEKLQTTSDENRIVIDDYKVTSKTLSNEIETLKQSLENQTNLESKHLETITELERDIRGLKDQLNEKTIEMSGQKELFKQEISEQTHQRENLEVKVSDLNNELSCNFEILKEKESNIERLEKEKESLGVDLCQQQKTSEELQLEVSELKKNEIENRITMEKMKADLGIAQDTLNTQTIERAASVADLEGKLEERTSLCAERENKIQLLTEELSKKCKEVTDKYSVCHNMEEKIKELENIIISHKSEIEGLEFEVSERKMNEEHQRNEIQKLLDVNTKYKNDLNEKANETRYSESVLRNHIQDLEAQSLQKDQTVLQLTEELSHYKADLESIADSKDKLLSQLEDTNFKLSQEISDVEASNGNMTLKIEGLQKELSKANNQVIGISSQLENAVKEKAQIEEICQKRSCQLQVSQSDCEELQEQMQSLEKKLAHLEKEKEIFEHREETFTERLTSLDMEKISMMRVLEEKQNVIDGQLTRIKDLEIDIDHKEAKLNSLVEKLRTAEIVKLDAEQNSEKLAGDLNEQKFCHDEKIKELENRLLMLNQDNQKASADKLELDKTNRELCILVERMEEKEKVLENELHEKQVECSSLDMKVNNLKKDCQDLEKKVLEFTKNLSESETERLKVGQSLSETEFKLEKVNEELSVSQTKNSELREEFNVSVLKTESLTNELCNTKLKLSETLESYGETQQSLKEKKDKIAELEDRVEKCVFELTEIKDKCSEDSLNMKNRTVEYENLLSELHNTVESKNIEINKYHELQSHLEHKMIKLEEKCNKAECGLSETLTTLQQKETLIEELKLNASETQSVLKDLEENVNRKQSEIQELKDRINVDSTHSTELSCAMQNEVKDLKSLLLSKSDEIDVLEKEIISKTDKLMHSQSKIEELDDIIKSNESLITKLSQDKDDLELNLIDKINTKESLIQSLEEKLIVHEKELEITLKEKKVIEQQLEALQTSYREKEIDLKTAALEKYDNKDMLLKLEEEKQNLVETIEKLHLDISAMRAENGNYQQKVGEAEHELLATQAFSQNLQSQLDERDHSYKSLQDKVSRLTTQNNELEAALQQSDIELQRTRLELEDKTTEQDDLFEKQNNESQELRDKISTLNNVIQNYERDIMSLENDKVNLIKDNQILITEKETVSIKLDSLENKNNDLAQSLEERQKRICCLEEGLETIRNDNDMFEIQIRKMKDEAVETNDHLSQLKILVTENEEENVKLRSKSMQDSSDMQIQQAKLRELELECQGKTSIIQELEDSVSSLREKHAAIDELNRNKIKDLTDSVSSLTNELQSKVQESSQRFAEVDSLAADLLESQAVNARSELEISELKEKFSSATHEIYIKEKVVENLETEVENLKLTASEVQDELIEKEKMHKESETQLCQLQTEFGQLQEQLRSVAAEKEVLESMVEFSAMENSEKDEKLSCLQQEMSDHLERHKSLQTMQKEFDDVSKELILVKQRTSEMEDLLNAMQIEKDSVCAESKEKDLELRGLKEKLVSVKAKEKEQESTIENLKDMMESLEFENNSLETEKAALENELKELTLKEKCCEQENNTLKEQICILGQEVDSLHSAIEQYKSKEQSYKDRSDAMNSELLEMKEKYKAVSSVETKLRGEVQELHAKIESMEVCFSSFDSQKSELLEARGELQTLSTEKISLQQKIATQEREKNDLLSQFLALEDQKSSADKDNSALQAQLQQLSADLEKHGKEKREITDKLDASRRQSDQLETQLEHVKQDHEKLKEINVQLVEQIENMKGEITSLEKEKNKLDQESQKQSSLLTVVKNLRKERQDMLTKITQLENTKAEQDESVENLKEQIRVLDGYKEKTSDLEAEVETLKKEGSKLEHYKEKVRELQIQVDSSKTIREKMKMLESQIASFKKEKEEVDGPKNQEADGGQSKEELQKTLEKWSSRCSKLNAQLTMEKRNVAKYQEQVQHLKTQVESQVKEKTSDLTSELESAQKEATEYLDKYHALTQRYTRLELECEKLQGLLNQKDVEKETSVPGISRTEGEPVKKRLRNSDIGTATVTSEWAPSDEKTPKRKSLSRSKSQNKSFDGKTTPKDSFSKQKSSSALISMTGKQSSVTDTVSEMEIECPSLKNLQTGSTEKTFSKPLIENKQDKPGRSPVQTRKRSLSLTRTETVTAKMTDIKPNVEELNNTIATSKGHNPRQVINQKRHESDSIAVGVKKSNAGVNESKQVMNTKQVSNTAPKGLRPTIKHNIAKQSTSAVTTKRLGKSGLTDSNEITVHCDPDIDDKSKLSESRISRTNVSSSKLLSQTMRSSSSLSSVKQGEALYSGSKLLQDLDQPLTRSQSKLLDSSQIKKNPLSTITNSPVKKSSMDVSEHKLIPPQRTLSLKKSPQLMRTRRKAKEEEEQTSLSEQEEAPECKVS